MGNHFRPYTCMSDFSLQNVCHIQLFFVVFAGLMIKGKIPYLGFESYYRPIEQNRRGFSYCIACIYTSIRCREYIMGKILFQGTKTPKSPKSKKYKFKETTNEEIFACQEKFNGRNTWKSSYKENRWRFRGVTARQKTGK